MAPELGVVVDGLALAGGDLPANVVRYHRNLVVGWRDKLLVLPIVEDARRRGVPLDDEIACLAEAFESPGLANASVGFCRGPADGSLDCRQAVIISVMTVLLCVDSRGERGVSYSESCRHDSSRKDVHYSEDDEAVVIQLQVLGRHDSARA